MSDNTYGYIKKRILDTLCEYTDKSSFVTVTDTDGDMLLKRIPDAVSSSLIRMYESLSVGISKGVFPLFKPKMRIYKMVIEKEGFTFDDAVERAAVVFNYSGEGILKITNEEGTICIETFCTESESLKRYAFLTGLPKDRFKVEASSGLSVFDFTVYEMEEGRELLFYPPAGKTAVRLPDDFSSFEKIFSGPYELLKSDAELCGKYAYFPSLKLSDAYVLNIAFRKTPPFITEETDDGYVFDLPPLGIEALIYLASAELCREGDNTKFTRLMYKYSDLSEGLRICSERKRNSFFKGRRRLR